MADRLPSPRPVLAHALRTYYDGSSTGDVLLDQFAAEVRMQVAAETRAACPDHGDETSPGCWPSCHCAVADDLEIEARKLAGEQGAAAPGGESCG